MSAKTVGFSDQLNDGNSSTFTDDSQTTSGALFELECLSAPGENRWTDPGTRELATSGIAAANRRDQLATREHHALCSDINLMLNKPTQVNYTQPPNSKL